MIRVGTSGAPPFEAGGAVGAIDGAGPFATVVAGPYELASRHTPMPAITRIETTTNAQPGILGV